MRFIERENTPQRNSHGFHKAVAVNPSEKLRFSDVGFCIRGENGGKEGREVMLFPLQNRTLSASHYAAIQRCGFL